MKELLIIGISAAIVNNVVLSQFLGLCPFFGVSKKIETAAGMGGAVIFVITLSSFVTSLIYKYILANPHVNMQFLQTIVFILVIAALVQFVEMFLKKSMPALYQSLGVYLPLITTNCAVLGVAVINVQKEYNVLQGTVNGFANCSWFYNFNCTDGRTSRKNGIQRCTKIFPGIPDCIIDSRFNGHCILWLFWRNLRRHGV